MARRKPSEPRRPRCGAITAAGDQCQNVVTEWSRTRCGSHGGARRKIGRPTKLNPDSIAAVTKSVEAGVPMETAARAANIDPSTLAAWRERGEADAEHGSDTIYAYFADELMRARAKAEEVLVQRIGAHAYTDWRAAAWMLERRAPERWAKRDRLDVEVSERAQPREVTPAEDNRDAILAILSTAMRPPAGMDLTSDPHGGPA